MIRHIRHKNIDRRQWDACIANSPDSLIYAYGWYLDTVCHHWDGLVLDDYRAVMPLPYTKKAGFHFALQPLFCQQLGIFGSLPVDEVLTRNFLDAIPARFRWVYLYLNAGNPLSGAHWRANYVLDLHADLSTVRSHYDASVRRNIRKSEKAGYTVTLGVHSDEVMRLFAWQNQEKKLGLTAAAFKRFRGILDKAAALGLLETIGLRSPSQELCAVGVYLINRERVCYLLGAMDSQGREVSALYRIMDSLIERKAGNGYVLDFEGSEIESIAHFFRKFGGLNQPYPVYKREGLGPLNSLIRKKFP